MLLKAENEDDEVGAEQIRSRIFAGIGRAVEQYVRLFGNTRSTEEHFERWVFGAYWKQHPRCLSRVTRNCLVSGEVVWQNAQEIGMPDWAAPAIQFCRALEMGDPLRGRGGRNPPIKQLGKKPGGHAERRHFVVPAPKEVMRPSAVWIEL